VRNSYVLCHSHSQSEFTNYKELFWRESLMMDHILRWRSWVIKNSSTINDSFTSPTAKVMEQNKKDKKWWQMDFSSRGRKLQLLRYKFRTHDTHTSCTVILQLKMLFFLFSKNTRTHSNHFKRHFLLLFRWMKKFFHFKDKPHFQQVWTVCNNRKKK
jgi:hypothetical protein